MLLVLGGARSGKSTFAEEEVKKYEALTTGAHVLYVATALAFDEGMKDRIKKHQAQRPSHWHTLESYKGFDKLDGNEDFKRSQIIMMDCMTLMITNLLLEYTGDFDTISRTEIEGLEKGIIEEVDVFVKMCHLHQKQLVIVANEVGLGLVPPYRLGSIFRDIAGRINQKLAKEATEVYLLTAGLPLQLK